MEAGGECRQKLESESGLGNGLYKDNLHPAGTSYDSS